MKHAKYFLMLMLACALTGCAGGPDLNAAPPTIGNPTVSAQATQAPSQSLVAATTVPPSLAPQIQGLAYDNAQYGFEFVLPDSWTDFSIVESRWEGAAISGDQAGKIVETGPELSIRHPKWTAENPRQDIPIMIFTLEQWDALQKETFHIGAAPIGPSELGRNSRYVFALPARYNYAFLTGFEEVQTILEGKPLRPIEPTAMRGRHG